MNTAASPWEMVGDLYSEFWLLVILAGLAFLSALGFFWWMATRGNLGLATVGSLVVMAACYIFLWRAVNTKKKADKLYRDLHAREY